MNSSIENNSDNPEPSWIGSHGMVDSIYWTSFEIPHHWKGGELESLFYTSGDGYRPCHSYRATMKLKQFVLGVNQFKGSVVTSAFLSALNVAYNPSNGVFVQIADLSRGLSFHLPTFNSMADSVLIWVLFDNILNVNAVSAYTFAKLYKRAVFEAQELVKRYSKQENGHMFCVVTEEGKYKQNRMNTVLGILFIYPMNKHTVGLTMFDGFRCSICCAVIEPRLRCVADHFSRSQNCREGSLVRTNYQVYLKKIGDGSIARVAVQDVVKRTAHRKDQELTSNDDLSRTWQRALQELVSGVFRRYLLLRAHKRLTVPDANILTEFKKGCPSVLRQIHQIEKELTLEMFDKFARYDAKLAMFIARIISKEILSNQNSMISRMNLIANRPELFEWKEFLSGVQLTFLDPPMAILGSEKIVEKASSFGIMISVISEAQKQSQSGFPKDISSLIGSIEESFEKGDENVLASIISISLPLLLSNEVTNQKIGLLQPLILYTLLSAYKKDIDNDKLIKLPDEDLLENEWTILRYLAGLYLVQMYQSKPQFIFQLLRRLASRSLLLHALLVEPLRNKGAKIQRESTN